MSDNQSYPHASAYGSKWVNTPGFDYVAREGVLFHNVFSASPGCAPSRSSILTGRYPWQNEEAGGHQTLYPSKYVTFSDVLKESGYHVGYTGKGCALSIGNGAAEYMIRQARNSIKFVMRGLRE